MKLFLVAAFAVLSMNQLALGNVTYKVTATLTGKDAKPFIDKLYPKDEPGSHIFYTSFGCGLPNSPHSYYSYEYSNGRGGAVSDDVREIYKEFRKVGVFGNSVSNSGDVFKGVAAMAPSSVSVENLEILPDSDSKSLVVRFTYLVNKVK